MLDQRQRLGRAVDSYIHQEPLLVSGHSYSRCAASSLRLEQRRWQTIRSGPRDAPSDAAGSGVAAVSDRCNA